MPRKLKVYQTSQGFFDLAVAAPSMKAALEAWGTSRNLFHQGYAKESDDSEVIAATMAKPGVVLQRPVGSNKSFREHAELPTASSLEAHSLRFKEPGKEATPKARKVDEREERRAAAAFEKEERSRKLQRQKDEIAAAKVRARRKAAIDKAEAALEDARRQHDEKAASIETDREILERRAQDEENRWQKLKSRLEAGLRKASR
jgi:colicin import membrane protein